MPPRKASNKLRENCWRISQLGGRKLTAVSEMKAMCSMCRNINMKMKKETQSM